MKKFFGKIAKFFVVFLGFDAEETQKINYNPDTATTEPERESIAISHIAIASMDPVHRLVKVSKNRKKVRFRSNNGDILTAKIVSRDDDVFTVKRNKHQVFKITGDQKVAV